MSIAPPTMSAYWNCRSDRLVLPWGPQMGFCRLIDDRSSVVILPTISGPGTQ